MPDFNDNNCRYRKVLRIPSENFQFTAILPRLSGSYSTPLPPYCKSFEWRWLKLGDFAGTDAAWDVPLADILDDDIDGAAVLVQQGSHEKPGIILGAAYRPLQ